MATSKKTPRWRLVLEQQELRQREFARFVARRFHEAPTAEAQFYTLVQNWHFATWSTVDHVIISWEPSSFATH